MFPMQNLARKELMLRLFNILILNKMAYKYIVLNVFEHSNTLCWMKKNGSY